MHGIGEKGGAQLIREWGDLETLLAHAGEVKNKRAREALLAHAEEARLSKQLATLRDDIPFEVDYERYRRAEPDRARLRELYRRFEFVRLLESLDAEAPAPRSDALARGGGVDVEVAAPGEWAALAARIATLPSVAIECVDDGGSAIAARPLGVAIAASADRATWLPLAGDASFEALAAALAPVLAGDVAWIGANTKRTQALFAERGVAASGALVRRRARGPARSMRPERRASPRSRRSCSAAPCRPGRISPAAAPSRSRPSFVPASQIAQWAGERAAAVAALRAPLSERLDGLGLTDLYEEVELPLTGVLAEMERAGVRIDEGVLAALSRDYVGQLGSIEKQIYAAAGQEFLISSPKQLSGDPVREAQAPGRPEDEDRLLHRRRRCSSSSPRCTSCPSGSSPIAGSRSS